MKYSLAIPLGFCLGQAYANILFPHVQLSCDPNSNEPREGITGCLRGQLCQADGTCKAWDNHKDLYPQSFQKQGSTEADLKPRADPGLSPDGKCGPNNGGLKCDPQSTVYHGTCCSSYGWCGNTPDHCGAGCQAAFGAGCTSGGGGGGGTPTNPKPSSTATGEPVLGSPTPGGTGGGVTTDGTCGANNANKVCGNWPQGSCCSLYGFCGNTAAHCGDGCQSGPCKNAPVAPAPGPSNAPMAPNPGSLTTLGDDPQRPKVQAGVPAMHAGLMPNGKVFFLDKVENYTQLKLSNGRYAYSAEYDPKTRHTVPLSYKTNAFCSGGAFLADGRMVSIGGNAPLTDIDPTIGDGFKAIRYLSRSSSNAGLDGQSWSEPGNKIDTARWYATVQTMPDGSLFVASGSINGLNPTVKANNNPTYELLNPDGTNKKATTPLEILAKNEPYYMYPFVHLLNNGQLMIFVAKSAQLFDVGGNKVVKSLPDMPGDYRTYPNTGGSVLLPLSSANKWAPDVMICGGGPYQDITSPTDASCGRIKPLDANPAWEMDSMPEGRGMVEGTLLPDGTVIWANGCNKGAQGFGLGANPTKEILIYDPAAPKGQRWHKGPTSPLERLYHSVTLLLLDGTLMIAGSNPVEQPVLKPVPNRVPSEDYVTNFKVEIYTPPYLSGANAGKRPTNVQLQIKTFHALGGKSTIKFNCPAGAKKVQVAFYHGGYVTHSLHMGHRMLFLDNTGFQAGKTAQTITVTSPPNRNVAQPGPYVVYVVVDGVPSVGQFVQLI